MPRYFFNVYHERSQLDAEGTELLDDKAAWREATVTAGAILRELNGNLGLAEWRLEVLNEAREPVYVIWCAGQKV